MTDSSGLAVDPITDLVQRFSEALETKLRASEEKYAFNHRWQRDGWREELIEDLLFHISKGDPLDVASYAAFAWDHQWSLAEKRHVYVLTEHEIFPTERFSGKLFDGFDYGSIQVIGVYETVADVHQVIDSRFVLLNESSPFRHSIWGVTKMPLNTDTTIEDIHTDVTEQFSYITKYNTEVTKHVYKLSIDNTAEFRDAPAPRAD